MGSGVCRGVRGGAAENDVRGFAAAFENAGECCFVVYTPDLHPMVKFADKGQEELKVFDGFFLVLVCYVLGIKEFDGCRDVWCCFNNIGGRVEVAVGDDVVP